MKYLLTILFLSTFLISCNKSDQIVPSNNVVKIDTKALARKIILDSSFANLYEETAIEIYNNEKMNKGVITDSINAEKQHIKFIFTMTDFILKNKEFTNLSSENLKITLNDIKELLKSKNFSDSNKLRLDFLETKQKKLINFIQEKSNSTNRVVANSNSKFISNKMDEEELRNCITNVIINALGTYSDVLIQVPGIIKGLSAGAMVKAVVGLFVKNSPWWKIATLSLTLFNCAADYND